MSYRKSELSQLATLWAIATTSGRSIGSLSAPQLARRAAKLDFRDDLDLHAAEDCHAMQIESPYPLHALIKPVPERTMRRWRAVLEGKPAQQNYRDYLADRFIAVCRATIKKDVHDDQPTQ